MPELPPEVRREKRFQVGVTHSQNAAWREAATRAGLAVQDYIRRAVDAAVERDTRAAKRG